MQLLRIALRRNADVLEREERVHEAVDRVPAAGRLPDLELKYEQWGVPLRRPYALDESDTVMSQVSLGQEHVRRLVRGPHGPYLPLSVGEGAEANLSRG